MNTSKAQPPATPVHEAESRKRLACRIGYAAHGAVYLLIGVLALDAAFGGGEQAQGGRGAIAELATGTLGTILLTVLAVGLFGYSFMRLWQGLGNPANHGNDAKGVGIRVGRVASGIFQAALAVYALSLAYGWFSIPGAGGSGGAGSGSGGADGLSARILSWPAGQWILGAIGVAICLAAFAQLAKAVKAKFLDELDITAEQTKWVRPLGRVGFSARFVVFLIAGGFIVVAAYQADPDEARGLGGALRTLQEQPYGPWLLAAVAVGLIAFALVRGVYALHAILPDRRSAAA